MKYAQVFTRIHTGMYAQEMSVEVHISSGLPKVLMVGLPEKVVKESIERVRSAILNSQFDFPPARITISLAPAEIPKEGGCFDLPIAIGILLATEQIKVKDIGQYEFLGELGLSGDIRSVKGVIACSAACEKTSRKLVLPTVCLEEACLVEGVKCLPAGHLLEVCAHLMGETLITEKIGENAAVNLADMPDISEVRGQAMAKRALEIAAAGRHHLLFFGPPGTGKTMLASRLPGLLGPLSQTQALAVASIHSLRGIKPKKSTFYQAPFRHPHHTASSVALVGGGSFPKPGEISLAHNGVLFLDELPEFDRKVLEVLREPLESGIVHIARANHQMTFPARFQLIAAMNPCPCGYYGANQKMCQCSPTQVARYQSKISGPLLDRIDINVKVDTLPLTEISAIQKSEPSKVVMERVLTAQAVQLKRQGCLNAGLVGKQLEQYAVMTQEVNVKLLQIADKFQLSARAYHRVLRVARTIADLAASESLLEKHVLEAMQLRLMNI